MVKNVHRKPPKLYTHLEKYLWIARVEKVDSASREEPSTGDGVDTDGGRRRARPHTHTKHLKHKQRLFVSAVRTEPRPPPSR